MEIGNGLKQVFAFAIILAAIIFGVLGYGIKWLASSEDIVSPHRLQPEIKLTITDNKVDTLYIYKKPR